MADQPPATPERSSILPERSARLTAVDIDGELVVYDPRRREAHLLNATAALLFEQCDGRTDIDHLGRELAQEFDVDRTTMIDHIEAAVAEFDRLGLTERAASAI